MSERLELSKRSMLPIHNSELIMVYRIVCGIVFAVLLEAGQIEPLEWSLTVEQELVEIIAENELAERVYSEVVSQARESGLPPTFIKEVFSHNDIQIHDEIARRFSNQAEAMAYRDYRKIFITDERIQEGREFDQKYGELVDAVADSFGVDRYLLLSIVGIESHFGRNSKSYSVFDALHTIIHKVPRKEGWVTREMIAYLQYCYENFISPHSIFGSYAGAFGYGQFIPSSFAAYAVDFNGDKVRHPFDWPDALASVANYLVQNGYQQENPGFERGSPNWKAILAYNPSANYGRVILEFRDKLRGKDVDAK
ncbi:MAG: lytic murein transglycosylase [Fidelibacterota bacterium]